MHVCAKPIMQSLSKHSPSFASFRFLGDYWSRQGEAATCPSCQYPWMNTSACSI